MTLIEVLVAIVLLSVGLLGLAGLQLRGMQVNQGSAFRAQAAVIAQDVADRMRSDYAAAQAGAFYGTYTPGVAPANTPPASLKDALANLAALPAGTTVAVPGPDTSPCTSNALPCVNIHVPTSVTFTAPPTPVEINVMWNDARAANAAVGETSSVGKVTIMTDL